MKVIANIVSSLLYLGVIVFIVFFANTNYCDYVSFGVDVLFLIFACCFCVSWLIDIEVRMVKENRRKRHVRSKKMHNL